MALSTRASRVTIMKLLVMLVMIAPTSLTLTAAGQRAAARAVEDIYVVRSVRTSRVTPTEFCAANRIGFGSASDEDRFTFHVTTTRVNDGKVSEPHGNQIGQLRACFGATTHPLKRNFYAEGQMAALAFTGTGECEASRSDFPEPGITVYRCFLQLTNLPRGYTGGFLTTSTVTSRQLIGPASDPVGYVQSSIATVRLWKER
jgi:hypothetical protein